MNIQTDEDSSSSSSPALETTGRGGVVVDVYGMANLESTIIAHPRYRRRSVSSAP